MNIGKIRVQITRMASHRWNNNVLRQALENGHLKIVKYLSQYSYSGG